MARRTFLAASAAVTATAAMPSLARPAFATSRGRVNRLAAPRVTGSGEVTVTTSGGRTLPELIPEGGPVLRFGSPKKAGLIPEYADLIPADAAAGLQPGTGVNGHAVYPGEVVIAGRNGVVAEH